MVIYSNGNLFMEPAQCYVNAVNCVGTMGKGIALEFKKRYPDYFNYYIMLCREGYLRKAGDAKVYTNSLGFPLYIISAATKMHYTDKSTLEDIKTLLTRIEYLIAVFEMKSIAIPALGCGLGGLKWSEVHPLMEKQFGDLKCEVTLYLPRNHGSF